MNDFLIMNVNQAFSQLCHNAWKPLLVIVILVIWLDKFAQISIRTVFKDNGQVLLLVPEEKLSSTENVGVIKTNVHVDLVSDHLAIVLGNLDFLKSICLSFDWFHQVDKASNAIADVFNDLIFINFNCLHSDLDQKVSRNW